MLVLLATSPLFAAPVDGCALDESTQLVPRNVRLADDIVRDHIRTLLAKSSLVRAMMSFISSANDTLVTIRGNPHLLLRERAGGLTRIGRFNGALMIHVEVNAGHDPASVEQTVLAHELGHAVEAVALPRLPLRQLGNLLMARQGHHGPWTPAMRFETSFAEAVERAVMTEMSGASPAPVARLPDLMAQHGLKCRDTSPPARPVQ